jgi:hypothetical protein
MSGHGRTAPGRDARIWREGYSAALHDLRRIDDDGLEGHSALLATLVEWLRKPEATARLAWRKSAGHA